MMTQAQLGLLGLGARAGGLVVGTNGVRAALQRDRVALVVVASDHGRRTSEKVVRLAGAMGIPTVTGPRAAELGRRLGYHTVQAVGVQDQRLAAGIGGGLRQQELRRA